jgi:hypothetical protein
MAIATTRPVVLERASQELVDAETGAYAGVREYLPSHPLRAATEEARHLHQLERAGESEWTPWIAIAGVILFYAATGLLMFGIVEVASTVLASASL